MRPPRVLLTGASGRLGRHLIEEAPRTGVELVLVWRGTHPGSTRFPCVAVDLCDPDAVAAALRTHAPDHVLHAAAFTDVDGCEREPERCRRDHVLASANVAAAAAAARVALTFVSSDFVFDGESAPASEQTTPAPLNAYGRAKRAAEREVTARHPASTILRGTFLGAEVPGRAPGPLERLGRGETVEADAERWFTPLTTACFAALVLEHVVAPRPPTGPRHLPGPERLSPFEWFRRLAPHLGVDPARVRPRTGRAPGAALRPRDTSLTTRTPLATPSLERQLAALAAAFRAAPAVPGRARDS